MPLLRPLALLGLVLPVLLNAAPHGYDHDHGPSAASGEGQAPPALFVANRGQWPDAVRFRAALGSGAVFAGPADLTFSVVSTEDLEAAHDLRHGAGNDALADFPVRGHAFRLTLVDAAPAAPEGLDRAATRFSYFLGQDPSRWASDVPGYRSVRHADAWPGIDWHSSAKGASPKYEFAVAPGADPSHPPALRGPGRPALGRRPPAAGNQRRHPGLNDHFAPISQFALNAYRFQIFNRWGELIFDATAPGTGWDGTWKGVDQEGGVYIYVLRAAEIEGVATGTVTLVR